MQTEGTGTDPDGIVNLINEAHLSIAGALRTLQRGSGFFPVALERLVALRREKGDEGVFLTLRRVEPAALAFLVGVAVTELDRLDYRPEVKEDEMEGDYTEGLPDD